MSNILIKSQWGQVKKFEGVPHQCKKIYKCSNKTSMSESKVVEQSLIYDEHVYDNCKQESLNEVLIM